MLPVAHLVTVPDAQRIMFVENARRYLLYSPERKSNIGSRYTKHIDECERPARPNPPRIYQPQQHSITLASIEGDRKTTTSKIIEL